MVLTRRPDPGDFSIFGITHQRDWLLRRVAQSHPGISPGTIDFGTAGQVFFFSTYADAAESDVAVVLKLGVVVSPSGSALSAQRLLQESIITPDGVQTDRLAGNAAIIYLDKTQPRWFVYQTLLSIPQIYYASFEAGVLCGDNLRTMTQWIDGVDLNEEKIPLHFLFRLIPGPQTYFKQINRLCPGQSLAWKAGDFTTHPPKGFQNAANLQPPGGVSRNAAGQILDQVRQVSQSYVDAPISNPAHFATLLSGGIDSSVIQLALNQAYSSSQPLRSFSYAMLTPDYQAEMEYANQAHRSLRTDHSVVEVRPEQYLDLLTKTIETAAYPSLCVETDPCVLALAQYARTNASEIRFFFAGHGADALFGSGVARKLLLLDVSRRIPGARWLLKSVARGIEPRFSKKAHGMQEIADILPELRDPDSIKIPVNTMAVFTDIDMALRCFGEAAIKEALRYRRDYVSQYLSSTHLMEQVHTVGLVTWDYEAAVFENQLFMAYRQERRYPFLDERILRLAYAIDPKDRYIKLTQVKYLLKEILIRNSLSDITRNPKRGGNFLSDLHGWMKHGPLCDRVQSIQRPGFISQKDFNQLKERPGPFLWELLIFDIFREKILDR
jgi:asparagine synthetase B (glutamine-hydrolysing)